MEQIAKVVNIKAPSIYKHYKGKRDIFNSIIKRMEENDSENADKFDMPEEPLKANAKAYKNVSVENLISYGKLMFKYWTEEEFSSDFRKMLTLEQYKNSEMHNLFQNYLSLGPLNYVTDIFKSMTDTYEEAENLALRFYGPMFLMYSVYDVSEDKAGVFAELENYFENFKNSIDLKIKEA